MNIKITADASDAKKDLQDVNSQVDNIGKNGKSSGGKFSSAMSAVKGACGMGAKAIGVAAGGAAALGGAFIATAGSTRDYRTEMGKLDTAFTTSGLSSQQAKSTYEALNSVLGDTEQAVEASGNLAKLCKNQESLSGWTNIATGVFATFGDGLPVESLMEAANETAKVGTVTGTLADALNWAGISEDAMNEKLAKCNTEAEREKLLRETLNGVYADASQKYQQTNADIIAHNQAQEKLNSAMAQLGASAEPLLSMVMSGVANLLTYITPKITEFAEFILPKIQEAFSTLWSFLSEVWGSVGKPIFDTISSAFTNTGKTADGKMNGIKTTFSKIWEFCKQAWSSVGKPIFDALKKVVGIVVDFFKQNWPTIKEIFKTVVDCLKTLWNNVGKPIFDFIMTIVNKVLDVFKKNMPAISSVFKDAVDIIKKLWEGVLKPAFQAIGKLINNVLKPTFEKVFNIIGKIVDNTFKRIGNIWNKVLKPILNGIIKFINGVFSGNWKKAFSGLGDIVKGVFNGLMEVVKAPIRGIVSLWNNTVAKVGFTIPDWIPGIGGKEFHIPSLPECASGGFVTGDTLLRAGEQGYDEAVVPLDRNTQWADKMLDILQAKGVVGGSGTPQRITIKLGENTIADTMINAMNGYQRQLGDMTLNF